MSASNGATAQTALARDCAALAGDVDAARWQLAARAAQARSDRVDDWAAIVSAACRRTPRRVREWVRVYQWTDEADLADQRAVSRYDAFEVLYDFRKRLDLPTLLEVYYTWRQDKGAPVKVLAGNLAGMTEKPEKDLAAAWERMSKRLDGQWASEEKPVADCVYGAARLLREAAKLKRGNDA